jgi:hypothetical protein
MVLSDGTSKMELLKTKPLRGKTTGEDIFQNLYATFLEMNVPIQKLVTFPTDGAPAMTSVDVV